MPRSASSPSKVRDRLMITQTVCIVVLGFLVGMLYVQRGDARAFYNSQIHKLVCGLPPGNSISDQLRSDYACGRYRSPDPAGTSSPSPAKHSRSTTAAAARGDVRSTSARRSTNLVVPEPFARANTRTRVNTAPARSTERPRTTIARTPRTTPAASTSSTAASAPRPTGTGPLGHLVCTVLGPLLCPTTSPTEETP